MGTAALISPAEYLASSYRPDCDLVDGVLEERNVGEKDHSSVQGEILAWFRERRGTLRLRAFIEARLRIRPDRYRVPDVAVFGLPEPDEQVFTTAPYICIEVLSPEDSLRRIQDRIDDYLSIGATNVWIIDPTKRCAWQASSAGLIAAADGVLRTVDGHVILPLNDLFLPWL